MTLVLDNEAVTSAVDMPSLIEVLELGMREEAANGIATVPRVNLAAGPEFFRVMPVVIAGMDLMGCKIFNGSATNGVRYLVALYAASSGELLALLDASYLTAARTGATSGLATKLMTPPDGCREVGVIGSGLEARTNLEGICAVREVERVKVFSPNPARRRRFAGELEARLGVPIREATSAEEAADAPAVLVATNTGVGSGVVAVRGASLRAGAYVCTIGSTMPALREVDAETFGRAGLVVVDTRDVQEESGDVRAAVADGCWRQERVRTLAELVAGGSPPVAAAALRVFKSVGTAMQDVLAAAAVFAVASERGLGRDVAFLAAKRFEAARPR